jgi:hypothetical protein
MPFSFDYFKQEFKEHLIKVYPKAMSILDAGAGAGTYGMLLRNDFYFIDACEIHEPNITDFNLNTIYNNVYHRNILEINLLAYDYIIMGDIVEHLTIDNAQKLIRKITDNGQACMVAVPYMMPQGAVGGNEYERHLQDDLTHKIVLERYPQLHLLFRNEQYGVYINY